MNAPTCMALASCLLLGCGPGSLGEAVAPEATTAAEALGDEELALTCRGVPEYGAPLIVDWSGQQRLDLEYRMNQGLAVVAYTCERFEVLDRCSVAGTYRFAGVSRKEDVVKLESRDELGVNLPLSGASLAASLERGSSIDLGLVLIGKKATTVRAVARPMLVGACEGATHFVQAATVGAFAMDRGTVGKTRAAAEIFNASASGSSGHETQQKSRDGELDACRTATPEAEAPPGQCQAALRLDLVPIVATLPQDAKGPGTGQPETRPANETPKDLCPDGMVRQGEKCTQPGPKEGALGCAGGILADCERSCEAGEMEDCQRLATAYASGNGVARDRERALKLYDRACGKDLLSACMEGGLLKARCDDYEEGSRKCAHPQDLPGGAKDITKACDSGLGNACLEAGFRKELASASNRTTLQFLERACDLGVGFACSASGFAYLKGEGGARKDPEHGLGLMRASCDGGDRLSCGILAGLLEGDEEMGVDRRPLELLKLRRSLCRRGYQTTCHEVGEMLTDRKDGIQSNPKEAFRYFELACQAPAPVAKSCLRLGRRYYNDSERALRYYTLACTRGGEGCAEAASIARAQTLPKLQKQCEAGQGRACDALADELLAKGCEARGGRPCVELEKRHPKRAFELLHRRCIYHDGRDPKKPSCKRFIERGGKLKPR